MQTKLILEEEIRPSLNGQYNIQVKFIRYDNAGENKKLEEKCDAEGLGISFEYTATGTPQQNAYAERAFPTLMGRARAMMNFAGFTTEKRKQLWCEAANTVTMLDNILVHEQTVHHPTLCFKGRMPNLPSICKHLVRFVSQQIHPTKWEGPSLT